MVTGSDGRLYAIGGFDGTSALGTAEAYDPTTGIWHSLAPMPTPRFELSAVRGPDGRLYAIGGEGEAAPGVYDTVEIYDPATNTWSTGTPLPAACYGLAATGRSR